MMTQMVTAETKRKTDKSAGSPYACPNSPKGRFHEWLLNDNETTLSDTSMNFEVSLVCKNCGREESYYGAIMDWKQSERWKAGLVPGEPDNNSLEDGEVGNE